MRKFQIPKCHIEHLGSARYRQQSRCQNVTSSTSAEFILSEVEMLGTGSSRDAKIVTSNISSEFILSEGEILKTGSVEMSKMLSEKLKNHHLILASASPRRQQLLREMELDFEVRLKPVEEVYPKNLRASAISDYLAELKACAFKGSLSSKDILITSDTVVWHRGKSLAKARNAKEARAMLKTLSDDSHEVITSVCFTTFNDQKTVHQSTKVKFKPLTTEEISLYIENYKPYDKAGAYGIQEWIGLIGIEKIEGSYPNVVGLPTQLVYDTLLTLVG